MKPGVVRVGGRSMGRCGGQALVETLAMLPFGIAVFIAVLLLARLHDIESHAIAAARYAAFLRADAPVVLRGPALDGIASARVWAPQSTIVDGQDQWTQQRFATGRSTLWRAPTDRAEMLASVDDVVTRTSDNRLAGSPGEATDIALSAAQAVHFLGRGEFDLKNERLLTARTQVRVAAAALPAPLDRLDLHLGDELTLLADSWSASGPEQVVDRVRPLMPTSTLGRLMQLTAPLQSLVALLEPEFRNLCVGHVDPEVVPVDRLGAASEAPVTSWRASCRP